MLPVGSKRAKEERKKNVEKKRKDVEKKRDVEKKKNVDKKKAVEKKKKSRRKRGEAEETNPESAAAGVRGACPPKKPGTRRSAAPFFFCLNTQSQKVASGSD